VKINTFLQKKKINTMSLEVFIFVANSTFQFDVKRCHLISLLVHHITAALGCRKGHRRSSL
jgi:hypothetical protein